MAHWGDCGPARATTPEYEEGIERIFGKKEKTARYETKMSEEQRKKQQMYPY